MKIGILSREYPPLTHVGGIATFSAAAAALLAKQGHEVHVVCNGTENSIQSDAGITVHRVKMLPHHFPTGRFYYWYRALYRKHLPNYLEALTWARTAANYLSSAAALNGLDVWEYPETAGEGAFFPRSAIGNQTRLVCRIHTGWLNGYTANPLERTLLLRLQKKSCIHANTLVSPSAYMANSYLRNTLGISNSVIVSRNPFSPWKNPIDWENKSLDHMLYVGRVEYRKGLQTLLKALDLLGEDAKGITLRVVGHMHPPSRELDRQSIEYFKEHLAKQAGKENYAVEYAGPSVHGDMPRHYDWAGIQVIPSLIENYPYVALEGLSRGCYLIGSNVGGIPEIIDHVGRGMLFEPENSTQLAEKIRECRRRKREISEGRRESVEQIRNEFAPGACYQRLMEVYGADLSQRTQI